MKKVTSITLALVLLALPVSAKLNIGELTVLDSVEDFTMVANTAQVVAQQLGGDAPRTVRICFSDWEQELCCAYTTTTDSFDCELYTMDGGG